MFRLKKMTFEVSRFIKMICGHAFQSLGSSFTPWAIYEKLCFWLFWHSMQLFQWRNSATLATKLSNWRVAKSQDIRYNRETLNHEWIFSAPSRKVYDNSPKFIWSTVLHIWNRQFSVQVSCQWLHESRTWMGKVYDILDSEYIFILFTLLKFGP